MIYWEAAEIAARLRQRKKFVWAVVIFAKPPAAAGQKRQFG